TSAGIPTANTDITLGFVVGSVWYDSATGDYYQCTDNTAGKAEWVVKNNVDGFGIGDKDFEPDFRSFSWTITGSSINYSTNVISYELRTIIDDPGTFGVVNPTETDPDGFL